MASRARDLRFVVKVNQPVTLFVCICRRMNIQTGRGMYVMYQLAVQAYEVLGGPRIGAAKISAAEIVFAGPIKRRWLPLCHTSGTLVNHGKAQLCVSVVFDPVGPVSTAWAVL